MPGLACTNDELMLADIKDPGRYNYSSGDLDDVELICLTNCEFALLSKLGLIHFTIAWLVL